MKIYLSILEAAHESGLSQDFLRKGCKNGTVPHIKSGTKYLIHYPHMLEALEGKANDGEDNC